MCYTSVFGAMGMNSTWIDTDKLTELYDTCKKLEAENKALKDVLDGKNRFSRYFVDESMVKFYTDKIKKLEDENERLSKYFQGNSECKLAYKTNADLNEKVEDLEKRNDHLKECNSELKEKYQGKVSEIYALKSEVERLGKDNLALGRSNNISWGLQRTQEKTIGDLQEEVARLRNSFLDNTCDRTVSFYLDGSLISTTVQCLVERYVDVIKCYLDSKKKIARLEDKCETILDTVEKWYKS